MKRFRITIKGIPPGILFNRMPEEKLLELRDKTGKRSKSAAQPTLEEEAFSHIHRDNDNRPCIPKEMLMASLINAGVLIRLDQKRQLSTKESTLLPGLLFLEGERWPLLMPGDDSEAEWGLSPWRYDIRQGRNPNGGEAVCIVRPLFQLWAITFTALLDTVELPEDTFLRLFTLAGNRMGIGDYRPNRKGVFGMFAITRWERLKDDVDITTSPKKLAA